jgi:shikimate kinase
MSYDYYDYAPRQLLDRPLVISGFFGSHPEQVGQCMCALSGLPFLSLAKLVEHRAGASIAHILSTAGPVRLSALEVESLTEQLPRRPFPIIALSEGTVVTTALLEAMCGRCLHLHLAATLVESYWRIRREMRRRPERYAPFLTVMPTKPDQLQPLLNTRVRGYRKADKRVPVSGLDALSSARCVLSALQLWQP